jgi:hypothetical protein
MEAAAGFPNVGFGPPCIYCVYSDYSAAPTNTLPVPGTPQLVTASGTSNGLTIYVEQTLVNAAGETTPSVSASQALTTSTQGQAVSPQAAYNATGYNNYASTSASGPFYLQNPSPIVLGTPYTFSSPLTTGTATPPVTNTAIGAGTGGSLQLQLYPNAMIGQVNIYYRARPTGWADTTSTSWTNLDAAVQEAAVIWAVMRVLAARQRSAEIPLWRDEFEGKDGNGGMIGDLKESINRRSVAKSGQVRDVRGGYGAGAYPWFMR